MYKKTKTISGFIIRATTLLFGVMFVFLISNYSLKLAGHGNIVLADSPDTITFSLSGYEWTDTRASVTPCNNYCKDSGYSVGTVTGSGSKVCAGAQCSYVSDFNLGTKSLAGNDGHCGCNDQFTCACTVPIILKPDLIVESISIEPAYSTTEDQVCIYVTIKNIGTKAIELNDLTAWTYVNNFHISNTYYGKTLGINEQIKKQVLCSKYGDNVSFKEGSNLVKVVIDPDAVNIVDEESEINNEKTANFTILDPLITIPVCGNNICEIGESPRGCNADCSNFKEVLDTQECVTWHAPNVFNYSPCGNTKIYNVTSGKILKFAAYGDGCASCVCYSLNFDIYDNIAGNWTKVKSVNDGRVKSSTNVFDYVPKGNQVKVIGTSGCFHFNLYQEGADEIIDNVPSASLSTAIASPKTVNADGKAKSALTVIVKNKSGKLLSNKEVTIHSNRSCVGDACANSTYTATTDSSGVAKVFVNSKIVGISTYTIMIDWNKRLGIGFQGVTLVQKPKVEFIAISDDPVCGNNICEIGESPRGCNADCSNFKEVLDTQECVTWHAPNVFNYSPCGNTKIYNVTSGKILKFAAYGDGCASCVCYSLNFDIYDNIAGNWTKVKSVNDGRVKSSTNVFDYVPKGNQVKVIGTSGCFHFNLYQEGRERMTVDDNNFDLTQCLPDGTLIKIPSDSKVYVVKDCKKQWIKSEEEFQQNRYDWSNVKDVSLDIVNAYSDYLNAQERLLKAVGQNRIYRIFNGKVLWIPTVSAFNAQGLKWDKVDDISDFEIDKYPKIKLIKTAGEDKIFYITNSGMKKHILTTEVFNSYNNKYSDVTEVDSETINSLETVNLFKEENGNKIYKIEGNKKLWIKSAEAFNRNKFDWSKVAPSNDTELNAYEDSTVIE